MITSIKTKNGTKYLARIKVKGERPSKLFDTRGDAEKWVNLVRFRRDQGQRIYTGPVAIRQLFEAYLEYAEEKGRAYSTLKSHRSNFKNYLSVFYGETDMLSVTHEEHGALLQYLKKEGVQPATRNRIRALVRVLYSVAIKGRLFGAAFKTNPFDGIEPSKEIRGAVRYLNQEQMDKLLRANRDSHDYSLLLLLLKTGLRIGEALGVHREQIDLTNGILTVDRQYDHARNAVVHRTKGKQVRVVYLIDEVLEALPLRDEGPLFRKPDGSKITSNYFLKFILPKACQRAEIKTIHPHGLRHSFAAHYLMNGGSIWDLSKILGHQSVEITERHYAHFCLEHVKRRMQVVERKGKLIQANFG